MRLGKHIIGDKGCTDVLNPDFREDEEAEDAAIEAWLRKHEHSASGDRRVYGTGWEQFEDYEVISVEV